MITVGVCDDNIQFARLLAKSLRTLCATELPERIDCRIAVEFSSCDDVLRYLEHDTINILFLDINMPTQTGFDLAGKLNQLYPDIIIIFVSAHDNFVYSSFEYSPFRFLRKTHLDEELPGAFVKAVESCMTREETVTISTTEGNISVRSKDILYFEGQRNYYLVHCTGAAYRCRGTISQAEELTKNLDFFRIHAAFVVNIANIDKVIGSHSVQMKDGSTLSISQRRFSSFREAYMKFTRRRFSV